MASPENKLLQTWFAPTLKAAGFLKTGPTWHRRTSSFIHVFNIQGSQWSRYFYFNLGVYITALGQLERPSEADSHIRERLDSIVKDRSRFLQISDFENPLPEESRRNEFLEVLSAYVIPWLDRMNERDQLRHYVLHEKKHGLPITDSTFEYLQIERASK